MKNNNVRRKVQFTGPDMNCDCNIFPSQATSRWDSVHRNTALPAHSQDRLRLSSGSAIQRKKVSISEFKKQQEMNRSVRSKRQLEDPGQRGSAAQSFQCQRPVFQTQTLVNGSQMYRPFERTYLIQPPKYHLVHQKSEVFAPNPYFQEQARSQQTVGNPAMFGHTLQQAPRPIEVNIQRVNNINNQIILNVHQPQEAVWNLLPENNDCDCHKKSNKLSQNSTEQSLFKDAQTKTQPDSDYDVIYTRETPAPILVSKGPSANECSGGIDKTNKFGFRRIQSINCEGSQDEPSFVLAHFPAGSKKQQRQFWNNPSTFGSTIGKLSQIRQIGEQSCRAISPIITKRDSNLQE